jgi:flagellin-like protein
MLSKKRGVSPLIATILLIAFAVALGSVVMNWGLNLQIGQPNDPCNTAEITIRDMSNGEVCYGGFGSNGYINFILDNTGKVDVTGLAIWIVGDKGTSLVELDALSFKTGSLYTRNDRDIKYDLATYGNIREVQFIPKINGQNICPKKAIKGTRIGICSQ